MTMEGAKPMPRAKTFGLESWPKQELTTYGGSMRRYGTTPGKPEEYRSKGQQAVTPKDAATLIIVKQGDQPRLLLGKRAMTHKFMPGKFVFPGGRLDYVDQRLRVPVEIQVPVMERLRRHTQARTSDAKLRGLALAAVRETFEETGLVLGTPSTTNVLTRHAGWRAFFNHGVMPPLGSMDFIARAITPPYRTRRFDTRFFMVFDDVIHSDPTVMSAGSGELLDLHWLTLQEARETDLPAITRMVIDIVEKRLALPKPSQMEAAAPFVRFIKSKSIVSDL